MIIIPFFFDDLLDRRFRPLTIAEVVEDTNAKDKKDRAYRSDQLVEIAGDLVFNSFDLAEQDHADGYKSSEQS